MNKIFKTESLFLSVTSENVNSSLSRTLITLLLVSFSLFCCGDSVCEVCFVVFGLLSPFKRIYFTPPDTCFAQWLRDAAQPSHTQKLCA